MTSDKDKSLVLNGAHAEPGFIEPVVNALNNIGKTEEQIVNEQMQKIVDGLLKDKTVRPAKRWESVTYCENSLGHSCTVWRTVDEDHYDETDMELKILMSKIPEWGTMKLVFDALSTLEGVTKIELRAANGDGVIKYLE